MFDRRSFIGKISGLLAIPFLPKIKKTSNGFSEIHYERNNELSEDFDSLIVQRGSFAWFGDLDELENARKRFINPPREGFSRVSLDLRIKPVGDSSSSLVTWKAVDKEVVTLDQENHLC